MNKLRTILLTILVGCISSSITIGQNVSNRKTGTKDEAYIDSLKKAPYEWRLPILGAKIRKLGFDMPYPNGIMLSYANANQYVTMKDLSIGTNPNNMVNVSDIVRFESVIPAVNAVNLRYDFWLLPFLNLYGMLGYVESISDIKMSLPISAEFQSNGKGPNLGWGFAAAAGAGPVFLTCDYNMVWTWMPQLEGAALAQMADIRVGHNFTFKKYPEAGLAILIGANWMKLNPQSVGSVDMSTVTGLTPEKKEGALNDLNDWYDGLSVNNQNRLSDFYDGMEGWLSGSGTTLHYTFDKNLYYPWSATIGANYSINKRFGLMAMYTFLGSREQLVLSFSYRFGFKGKNMLSSMEFYLK